MMMQGSHAPRGCLTDFEVSIYSLLRTQWSIEEWFSSLEFGRQRISCHYLGDGDGGCS